MNKVFIFDMDGVIVDSENAWRLHEGDFFPKLFGKEITEKIGPMIGLSANCIFEKAVELGLKMDQAEYLKRLDNEAFYIYSKAKITKGIDILGEKLISQGFKLGLVSSSRKSWIDKVLSKISFSNSIEHIISINDRPDLKPKPDPDAYLETIKKLGANPNTTIILEDSNLGIKSAKATGAYVIGFRENLLPDYKQEGADVYANNIYEVIEIINKLDK